jgi:xanthine dehydrogenase YagR molybdenum-binding subunit
MSNAAPEPKENMGKPEPRIDGRLKVTGEARYGSDFPVANPAYAFLVTSAIARGRIMAMDLGEAKAVPGVLEIFHHGNSGELKDIKYMPGGGGPTSSIQDFGPEIRYGGQIIALVVAETFEASREAAHKVHVTYQAEQPSATFDSSGVNEQDISRQREVPQAGDAEAVYSAAEVKLDAEYETPTQHHNPIELFTTTCIWQGDELTIYEPSQFVYGLKANAAKKMGIDIANVHAVSPFVGGAFGSKAQFSPRTGLVALAARRLNRPVKLVATRGQGFTIQTYRAETRQRIRMGAQTRRKDQELYPRRVGSDLASGCLFRGWRGRQRTFVWLRRGKDPRLPGTRGPQHAGLHALTAGSALHLWARKRDGRACDQAQPRPGGIAPHQRFHDGCYGQAVVEPVADEMLR